MKYLALGLIRIYQVCFSPVLGTRCRFVPSCSEYTYDSIKKYGIFMGIRLGGKRLLKCHSFHPGGIDRVP